MQKYSLFFVLPVFFLFGGCTSTKGKNGGSQSLTHLEFVPHNDSVVASENLSGSGSNPSMDAILYKMREMDTHFFAQDCDGVLKNARELNALYPDAPFLKMPSVFQTAVFVCDAKTQGASAQRVQRAISALKELPLHYPAFNEAWVHSTLGDLYTILGDKKNAVQEKKSARELVLANLQNVSALNSQILNLNPSEKNVAFPETAKEPDSTKPSDVMTSAVQLLRNDSPEQALALIDEIPQSERSPEIKQLRNDAITALVAKLRYRVRLLFNRSTSQTGEEKTKTLRQCEQILQGIVDNYPEYKDMSVIHNNLKQLRFQLAK